MYDFEGNGFEKELLGSFFEGWIFRFKGPNGPNIIVTDLCTDGLPEEGNGYLIGLYRFEQDDGGMHSYKDIPHSKDADTDLQATIDKMKKIVATEHMETPEECEEKGIGESTFVDGVMKWPAT
jgi:hypothetical protein